jgi:hypothetical protein
MWVCPVGPNNMSRDPIAATRHDVPVKLGLRDTDGAAAAGRDGELGNDSVNT